MFKYLLIILLLFHGLIHILGFLKAFDNLLVPLSAKLNELTLSPSKTMGIFWLIAFLLFIVSIISFLSGYKFWWLIAFSALLLSQFLILNTWTDAKYGTIPNILLLIAVIFGYGYWSFEKSFKDDIVFGAAQTPIIESTLISEKDITPLPELVQKYLRFCGVINTPKITNFRAVFEGKMRDKGKDWFPFKSEQYNFVPEPTRLFYMCGKMFGITVPGYHHYKNGTAVMDIRLFGLFSIIKKSGAEMNKTETVTLFNDLCLLAPAALIDKRISWENIDSNRVKATFVNHGISITAILYFGKDGELVNFTSEDRMALGFNQRITFSTPVHEYKEFNGIKVVYKADAVWHYPSIGEFTYGVFELKDIKYNVII